MNHPGDLFPPGGERPIAGKVFKAAGEFESGSPASGTSAGAASPADHAAERICLEASNIVEAADAAGVTLRLVGSAACRICCREAGHLFVALDREAPGDLDFVGLRKQSHLIVQVMGKLGYESDRGVMIASEGARHIYKHRENGDVIDVFTDELDFNHKIALKNRLDLAAPTLSPSDLLLSKLQIVEVNLKDLKDAFVLLARNEIADGGAAKTIDSRYIGDTLAGDWGFHYTFTTNIQKLRDQISIFAVDEEVKRTVERRAADLIAAIDETPKSMRWKLRSKLGAKARWYQVVEEKGDTF
nr:hypothetical protein DBT45_09480 [Aerococcus tenax]